MRNKEKNDPSALLRKGLRDLARHHPDLALAPLRQAVDATPPSCGDELSRALYWLSVALARLNQKDLALKSLSSAQKLRRRGFARSLYLRSANEYGMPRRQTAELDDFHAFVSIQLSSYLLRKPNRRFSSASEREIVLRIVVDTWKTLRSGPLLEKADCGEKLALFRRARPSFPSFGLDRTLPSPRPRTLKFQAPFSPSAADFGRRCSCGSGLPYGRCCGRVRGLGEL